MPKPIEISPQLSFPPFQTWRVVIAEDHTMIHPLLSEAWANAGAEVVGHARDATEAMSVIAAKRANAVSLDIQMGAQDGFEVLDRRTALGLQLIVVISDGINYKEQAYLRGATAFIPKSSSKGELFENIIKATRGEFQREAVKEKWKHYLSEIDITTLELYGTGASNETVANILQIKAATLRTRLSNLREILNLTPDALRQFANTHGFTRRKHHESVRKYLQSIGESTEAV